MSDWVWWRDGVLYQVYPRSFADSDGDGVGDLRGIIERLDHLAWLGVDGLWLNPTFPSPNADWGFDVSDYRDVHPDLGTLDDLDELVAQAGARDMHVLLDLVPNHTSDEHDWFVEARSSREDPRRDFYVWRDPAPDGGPPNNWVSIFGGSAWERDDATGQFYLHLFHSKQPDLDWWSDRVRDEFDDILRFWFARGIAGFRIDVAHGIVKHRELRDNPAAEPHDAPVYRWMGQRPEFSMQQPEVHDVHRRWRALADEQQPERVLLGETWVLDLEALARLLRRRPRRAAPGLQLRLPRGRLRHRRAGADRRPHRGAAARARVAGVDAGQPRPAALPDALGAGRRAPRAARPDAAAHAARHAGPLLRRRDRDGRRRRARRTASSTPSASCATPSA